MSREKKSGRLTHFKTMPQAAGKNGGAAIVRGNFANRRAVF